MASSLNIILSTQGGQGRDVLDAALACDGQKVRAYATEMAETNVMGELLVLDSLKVNVDEDYFVALRRSEATEKIIQQYLLAVELVRVIHPKAYVSPFATLGANTFIAANAVVNPGAILGDFVFLNAGSVIDHDCIIGSGTTFGPGVTLPGFVTIGENCSIGAGVSFKPGVCIAAGTTLGAGAVVVKDILEPGIYVGNPTRRLG